MFNWLMQYLEDWNDLRQETTAVAHRVDEKGGEYFWATQKDSKGAIAAIKKQLKAQKVPYKNARFGGIYIPNPGVAKQVYETLMHQGGYFIANYCRLGAPVPR